MKTLIRMLILIIVMALTLPGCSPTAFIIKPTAFIVNEADNRFTENKNQLFISKNNRISTKSIDGGIYIDDQGLYIDPFVEKDLSTGRPVMLGFNLVNNTHHTSTFGAPNSFGTIEQIIFRFSNGELINLPTIQRETQFSDTITYNPLAGYAAYELWETATAMIELDEYERIADADSIAVQIIGSKRSMVYEVKDIAPAFLTNLRQFRNFYIHQ